MKLYLDNAATTPVAEQVIEIMNEFMSNKFGNPSSLHSFGREAREAIESSRKKIAEFIKDTKCFCTHECFWTTNILFNPKYYPKILVESIKI